MPRPRHLTAESRCYFVTANTHGKTQALAEREAAQIVIDALYHLRSLGRIRLHAFVVMPDHFHFITSLSEGETVSRLMHSLKSYTANEINRRRGERCALWQQGSYSHGIRDERDMVARVNYIGDGDSSGGQDAALR